MTREEIEQHAQEIENWMIEAAKNIRLDHWFNNTLVTIKLDNDVKAGFVNHEIHIVRHFDVDREKYDPIITYYDGSYDEACLASIDHIKDTGLEFKVHLLRDWSTIKPQVVAGIECVNADAEKRDREKVSVLAAEERREKSLCDSITSFEL